MTRRHWARDSNNLDRQERRDLVRAAGSHRRWAMTGSGRDDVDWVHYCRPSRYGYARRGRFRRCGTCDDC